MTAPAGAPQCRQLHLEANLQAIPAVHRALATFAQEAGLDDDLRDAFGVALDEVLTNIVMHGYERGPGGIQVRFSLDPEASRVSIEVLDEAPPFDPLERDDPPIDQSVDERPVGGLGIYLVKELMDHVDYERRGAQNSLRLTKHLPSLTKE